MNVLAVMGILGGAFLFLYTRRVELLALVGLPMALRMVTSFRTSALITTCAMFIWLSRVPTTFFDLSVFSYVVYASLALSIAAFCARAVHRGTARLPLVTNLWLALYVGVVLYAGITGMQNAEGIPAWMLAGANVDYGIPWVYFRSIVLPGIFLPLLALVTATAIVDRQKLESTMLPAWIFGFGIAIIVVGYVLMSGIGIGTLSDASFRNEHLKDLGFHSNELGTLLALAYALTLGGREALTGRRVRVLTVVSLAVIAVALVLTFSRGALLAFIVVNALFFAGGSSRRRMVFAAAVAVVLLFAPAAVFERAQFGLGTWDLNEISAGRLDNIWLPLLPDIGDHLLVGQGLHSIMWTDAQRLQQIYPVMVAHNAYLDLLLDVGVVGTMIVLGWYFFLYRGFRRGAATDPDPRFRAVFYGGYLALVALLVCALSNDRLTPTAPSALLWLAAGVLLGRQAQLRRMGAAAPAGVGAAPIRKPMAARPLVGVLSRGEA